MSSELKKRKPNWSERELLALAEAVAPRNKFLKGKLTPGLTTEKKNDTWCEIADQVNCVTMVSRTLEEMKKKWADMQSMTKKKEAERRRSMTMTGGGPAPEFYFKEWEKVVLQTLSDIAIEGISCGVDTAECLSKPSSTVQGITLSQPASELSQSAITPGTSTRFDHPITQAGTIYTCTDVNAEKEYSQTPEKPGKQAKVQRKENEVSQLLNLEKEKVAKLEEYRAKKIKILEEMLDLQRRSTIAVESLSNSMQNSGNSQPLSMSLSPVIKFS